MIFQITFYQRHLHYHDLTFAEVSFSRVQSTTFYVNSDNGLVLSGNKPLPETTCIYIYMYIYLHIEQDSLSRLNHIELTLNIMSNHGSSLR